MLICGLKLSHDAAICVIKENRLLFCVEIEKLENYKRHSEFEIDFATTKRILGEYDLRFEDIDRFVIDGWIKRKSYYRNSRVSMDLGYKRTYLPVANYGHFLNGKTILKAKNFHDTYSNFRYRSYRHISSHLMGSYCSSPFSEQKLSSFLLVWDGGISPQLFYFNAKKATFEAFGQLMPITGNMYSLFSQQFKPFNERYQVEDRHKTLDISGKVMAYISLGCVDHDLLALFISIYEQQRRCLCFCNFQSVRYFTLNLIKRFIQVARNQNRRSEDILATFHLFLQKLLITQLEEMIRAVSGKYTKNLCYSGGCALNIKWNTSIRNLALFDHIWVPPFTNDSGSAIGVACCEMYNLTRNSYLEWDVFSGPRIKESRIPDGWNCIKNFSLPALAKLIHLTNEPVILLDGCAEIGPRALGARSILASATNKLTKETLNKIKDREPYRPVAPICLETEALNIFEPGIADPYMLFDHYVKEKWIDRVPAILHLDQTARVQTVNKTQNPLMFELLTEYYKLSGIPLLCNTSANYKGKGFFPDVRSAAEWGGVNYIWSDGSIFYKINCSNYQHFHNIQPNYN